MKAVRRLRLSKTPYDAMNSFVNFICLAGYVVVQAAPVDFNLFPFQSGFAGTVDRALVAVVKEQVGVEKLVIPGVVDNNVTFEGQNITDCTIIAAIGDNGGNISLFVKEIGGDEFHDEQVGIVFSGPGSLSPDNSGFLSLLILQNFNLVHIEVMAIGLLTVL